MQLLPGNSVGRYRILAPLGAGGMGEVYRASDPSLGREVALKVLRSKATSGSPEWKRFEREARAASVLSHANVVSIFDFGTHEDSPYLVSEFVRGETLREVLKRGPMPLRTALDIAVQIADALADAHQSGVVHRDIKPENVLITGSNRVKIVDFGLAKVEAPTPPLNATRTISLTGAGAIVGTFAYMSPEQARGTAVDFRTDQFSFGLVLFEMITGEHPFRRATPADTIAALLNETAPQAIAASTGAARPVQWVLDRCLAKDPAKRYAATADLHKDIGDLRDRLEQPSGDALMPRRNRSWRGILAGLGSVVVLAAMALTWLELQRDQLDMSAYRFTPFAMDLGFQGFPAWSPDGRIVAYAGEVDGALQIFKRGVGTVTGDQLTRADSDCSLPFWSPDGTRIYYINQQQLWEVGAGGGQPELVYRNVLAAAMSPDGRTLALARANISGEGGLWIASPVGAQPARYAPFASRAFIDGDLHFSPDGKKLAISMITGDRSPEFWVVPLPKGEPRSLRFLSNLARWHSFSWMPDSRRVMVGVWLSMTRRGQLWMADTDRDQIRPISISTAAPRDPAVSPDGNVLAFTSDDSDSDLVEIPLNGGPARPVIATPASEHSPVWRVSGDGLAYITDRSGVDEIWIRSHGEDRPVVTEGDFPTGTTFYLSTPAFSPDGQRIAFTRRVRGGTGSIWISPVAGGRAVRLTAGDSPQGAPTWSPDGNWIAHTSIVGGRATLVKTRVGGSGGDIVLKENLTSATAPQWSPDGRWITFGEPGLFGVVSPDGRESRVLAKETWAAHRWSKDGSTIFGVRLEGGKSGMCRLDVATGVARTLFTMNRQWALSSTRRITFAVSPDEKGFLSTEYKRKGEIWLLQGFRQRLGIFEKPWRHQVPD
jgi:serine/threonine protein kinase/Tol biopolymer transport system component